MRYVPCSCQVNSFTSSTSCPHLSTPTCLTCVAHFSLLLTCSEWYMWHSWSGIWGLEKEAILGCLSPDIVGTKEIWKFTPMDKDKTLLLDCGSNTQVPTLLSSRGPPTPTQTTMKTHTIDQNLLCLRVLSWQTVRIRNPKRFLRETNSFQSS